MVHWVTQRVVASVNFIHVHQRVVGEGRRSDRWDVKVFTIQAWARVGLKDNSDMVANYHPLLQHCAQTHMTPADIITSSIMDLAKTFQTLSLSCRNFTIMHRRKLPQRHSHFSYKEYFHQAVLFFQEAELIQISKVPLKFSRVFNLAEYLFHGNCREGRQFIKLMFNQTCFIGLPTAQIMRCNKMNSRSFGAITFGF